MREEINNELETMYTEDICSYPVSSEECPKYNDLISASNPKRIRVKNTL